MPLPAAVVVAYAIGMSVGFTLYRRYVFPGSDRPIAQQTLIFIAVNLLGAVVVLAVTLALLALQQPFGYPLWIKEGLSHGLAIGVGAVINFIGHKTLTFSLGSSRRTAPLADHGDRR
jgi:putative flippase GtrA